jgi:2-phosphosulfolactate phosphatase
MAATASYISQLSPEEVTFVITGMRPGGWGDEVAACADYLSELLKGCNPSHAQYLQRVRESPPGRLFLEAEKIEFDYQDLEYCLAINRFNFAMPVSKQDGRLIIVAHSC